MHRLFRRYIRKTLSANIPPVLQEANFVLGKGEVEWRDDATAECAYCGSPLREDG